MKLILILAVFICLLNISYASTSNKDNKQKSTRPSLQRSKSVPSKSTSSSQKPSLQRSKSVPSKSTSSSQRPSLQRSKSAPTKNRANKMGSKKGGKKRSKKGGKKTSKKSTSTPNVKLSNDMKMVCIGDVHGDDDTYRIMLQEAGLVDSGLKWKNKKDILVQTGDLVDRGPKDKELAETQDKIFTENPKNVYPMLGNHEIMVLSGDMRYTKKVKTDAALAKSFTSCTGEIFKIWKRWPVLRIVGNTLFMHGGMSSDWARYLRRLTATDLKKDAKSVRGSEIVAYFNAGMNAALETICKEHEKSGEIKKRSLKFDKATEKKYPFVKRVLKGGQTECDSGPTWYRGYGRVMTKELRELYEPQAAYTMCCDSAEADAEKRCKAQKGTGGNRGNKICRWNSRKKCVRKNAYKRKSAFKSLCNRHSIETYCSTRQRRDKKSTPCQYDPSKNTCKLKSRYASNNFCDDMKDVLRIFGVERQIIGHTIQKDENKEYKVNGICDCRTIMIDTANSVAYGRHPNFVVLTHNGGVKAKGLNTKTNKWFEYVPSTCQDAKVNLIKKRSKKSSKSSKSKSSKSSSSKPSLRRSKSADSIKELKKKGVTPFGRLGGLNSDDDGSDDTQPKKSKNPKSKQTSQKPSLQRSKSVPSKLTQKSQKPSLQRSKSVPSKLTQKSQKPSLQRSKSVGF